MLATGAFLAIGTDLDLLPLAGLLFLAALAPVARAHARNARRRRP